MLLGGSIMNPTSLARNLAVLCLAIIALRSHAQPAAPPRGYSIPLLDLADQKNRQVIVDKEPGQYLGHPTTVLLEDGKTILCVYPKGHGKGAIVYKKSLDGGRNWSARLPTPKTWATSLETPTIHRVIDPKGVKRLIMFSGLYPIRMAVSENDGESWSELSKIGDYGGIVAMGSVERLKNGDYLALFHDDGRFIANEGKKSVPQTRRVYKVVSKDGGVTWSRPMEIAHHPEAFLCEPGLIRSPDGKQIAVLLRENSRKFNSFVIFSNDEGETWSKPRELPGALTGDRHTGRYAPDGRLFITFRDTTLESSTKGDWAGWVGTYDDIVKGREGQYRVRLMKNHKSSDCAYPGLELLPDGTFVTTTYGHWIKGEQPFIVSVRFTMQELDALAKKREQTKEPVTNPQLIGHRGLMRHAPENTLVGFNACIDLGLGFELDIRRTKDGHLVVMHDDDVGRTTNSFGKVADYPLSATRMLDAGRWFDPAFTGEKVPLLDEVFAMLKQRKRPLVLVALDFKIAEGTVERHVVRLAEKHGVLDQVICIGLAITDPAVRRRLREANPKTPVAVLAPKAEDLPAALKDANADWIYLRFVPSAQQVEEIHKVGKRIFLSGPLVAGHDVESWHRARKAGVDAMLTDYPLECRLAWRGK